MSEIVEVAILATKSLGGFRQVVVRVTRPFSDGWVNEVTFLWLCGICTKFQRESACVRAQVLVECIFVSHHAGYTQHTGAPSVC